nr:LysE family translocator [Pelagibacterium limicola]
MSFAIVAGLLVISPGPNGVLIAKTVPTSGALAGFANIAGFMVAFYCHWVFALLGGSLILATSADLFTAFKLAGAAYLCWLGFKSLREAWRGGKVEAVTPARRKRGLTIAFGEGMLTNLLNPKVSMFYLAAFPQFVPVGAFDAQHTFVLVLVHSLINLVWFGIMIAVIARVGTIVRSGAVRRWLKGVTGVVLIGFGAKLATLQR